MTPAEALKSAIRVKGTQEALADTIGKKQAQVSVWLNRDKRTSPIGARLIEQATGISKELLRPDIYGPPAEPAE